MSPWKATLRSSIRSAIPALLLVFAAAGCAAISPDFPPGEAPPCPVMGDPAAPEFRAEYEERDYYFCCAGCRDEFVENPGLYLDRKGTVSHAK